MHSPIDIKTAKALNDSENTTSLASAQRNDPALKHLLHWTARGALPSSHEIQRLPRTTCKLAHEFGSLKVVNDILCREFIHKGGSLHHQQLILASLEPLIAHKRPPGIIQNSTKGSRTFPQAWLPRRQETFHQSLRTVPEKSQPTKDPLTFFG